MAGAARTGLVTASGSTCEEAVCMAGSEFRENAESAGSSLSLDGEDGDFWSAVSDAVRVVNRPDYPAWAARVRSVGGCVNPIHLVGFRRERDASTGAVLR